jgi:hypothetical protein
MPRTNRKSAMKVVDGTVRKKNNWAVDGANYYVHVQREIVLDRLDPGSGRRHVLTKQHLRDYLEIVPDFTRLGRAIDAIVLSPPYFPGHLGRCHNGVVTLCSWERELWWDELNPWFFEEIGEVLELLGVEHSPVEGTDRHQIRWTEDQARAFQLTYILSHELGHHHDQITNRSWKIARGEPYAEAFALEMMRAVWPEYVRRFAV